jgi:hypothetical protein
MPNDAKLGLLAGVLGVIVAAVVSADRQSPAPATNTATPPKVVAKPPSKSDAAVAGQRTAPSSPAVLPTELNSTPVVRTRKEPDATPASRARNDDDIEQ